MKNPGLAQDRLLSHLKHLIADVFRMDILEPDKIADHERLSDGGLGLDSLDTIELAMCIEETFGIAISDSDGTQRSFVSIASLADFIHAHAPTKRSQTQRHAGVSISYPALTWTAPV